MKNIVVMGACASARVDLDKLILNVYGTAMGEEEPR